ncbi:RimK family alpha-L-glutamate ligase [Actinoplanes sp. NPDC051513]|uniref:RimK family alpha-L-glutamate ligase n=1 Tax=Actinoplanes sp. NPDC051513 TaxID=3363908 RepID=UPI003790032C
MALHVAPEHGPLILSTSTTTHATREQASRVALVTCDLFPDLWDDDFPLRDALRARSIEVDAVRWDDPDADWDVYDLAILRSPWDYVPRRDAFLAWARRVPRLLNPADVLVWNTDKRYLHDLASTGVPVTPTTYVAPGGTWTPSASGDWVVKPTISAGSQDTGRYTLPAQSSLATAHVERLLEAGRTAMIQPYLSAVDTAGETALMFFPDATGRLMFSHAVRKGPMLTGPDEGEIDPGSEEITARQPSAAELATAEKVLAAIPFDQGSLLYARVDLIPGPDGDPMLLELELTEPSLFLRTAPKAAERLADAVVALL